MGAGKVKRPLDEQHAELLSLAAESQERIIPFCSVDPRREDAVEQVAKYLAMGFAGVKIYPNLGYLPNHERLLRIYTMAEQQNKPIMVHCSPGGVLMRGIGRDEAGDFSHPRHFRDILEQFPQLRICLAHYGGSEEWQRFLLAEPELAEEERRSRLTIISEMLAEYPNLYSDISYTMFQFQENIPVLQVHLADPAIRRQVLFGSDYYMIEREQLTERQVSIQLRAALGERLFRQIAETNPCRYLGIPLGEPDSH